MEPSDYNEFCSGFRTLLEKEAQDIAHLLNETQGDSDPVELDQQSTGRLTRMDAIRSQAMAAETRRRREIRCQQIEAALKRIEDGEFGYCADCGDFIGEGRLQADPVFLKCIKCAG
ncbi:MAG: TraR/DksA C4-type zinc finger protein [Hyphomicrobiales bacterium]|nr:TraR/DksA C4-type zinc finger protein [Hyphomicrobiales bacterium]